MDFIPVDNYILCEKIVDSHVEESTIIYTKEELPIYKIINISKKLKNTLLSIGDCVIINATGTLVKYENKDYYLINEENVIGKIKND
jgi:co-chaperonin GroES (HSP10)